MTTKEKVYSILKEREGAFVSGEEIGASAGVSRASVWKAVSSLQGEGFNIEGVSNKGYRLLFSDIFSPMTIGDVGMPYYFHDEIDSTNNEAKRLISKGVKAPFVVIAPMQTGGRGRRGRTFVSPPGGIYLSLVIENSGAFKAENTTTKAALALSETIDSFGFETGIKWVNDVYLRDKKCVGILTEGVMNMEDGTIGEIIIGIGVNFSTRSDEFPPDVRKIATSLYPDGNPKATRCDFTKREITDLVRVLKDDNYVDAYRKKCFVLGKDVDVISVNGTYKAKAIDLDGEAHLVVEKPDGERVVLSSGEVSIRPSSV